MQRFDSDHHEATLHTGQTQEDQNREGAHWGVDRPRTDPGEPVHSEGQKPEQDRIEDEVRREGENRRARREERDQGVPKRRLETILSELVPPAPPQVPPQAPVVEHRAVKVGRLAAQCGLLVNGRKPDHPGCCKQDRDERGDSGGSRRVHGGRE